jgi:AcrR family transcriptional regulator
MRERVSMRGADAAGGDAAKREAAAREKYHHGDLRAALLVAAEAELAEKGVEGFTLRGCAKRAGVSHAAPAYHFGDADGLLTALAAEGFERFTAAMRRRIAHKGATMTAVDAAGLGYLDFALANPALFRLMFTSRRLRRSDERLGSAAGEAFSVLEECVGDGRGGDALADRSGVADLTAAWALAHGLAELMISGQLFFLDAATAADRDGLAEAAFRRLRLSRKGS